MAATTACWPNAARRVNKRGAWQVEHDGTCNARRHWKRSEKEARMAKQVVPPILVVFAGVAWLLNVTDVFPGVDWLWTVSIATIGIIALTFGGINRVTVVVCPFLITASIFSVMRQSGVLSVDKEVPILTIALGVYWLIASVLNVPLPKMMPPDENEPRH